MCDVCERDREKQNREESRVESCILERVVVVPIKITANKTMYTSTSNYSFLLRHVLPMPQRNRGKQNKH